MSLNTYPYNPFPASTDKLDEAHNAELQQEVDQLKEDTGELQEDVEKLETDKTDTTVIAPEFDAEAGVYAVGDLVMYQGKLYEFTTAHETAGDWDSTEVTEKTIADEIDTVKSGLNDVNSNLTSIESDLDDVVVEYAGPAHSSDGRYYYFYFTTPFQSDCNRTFFDIIYGGQHSFPAQVTCMYSTDGSTTAGVVTDDTNITAALADGELIITIDCGASAWVIPALRIKKKYGDLLTIH